MALVWISSGLPPVADDRVSISQATCPPFRAECYAYEPNETTFFYDIHFVSGSTVTPYLLKVPGNKVTGPLTTPARAQRAAALKLQEIADRMKATLGVVR